MPTIQSKRNIRPQTELSNQKDKDTSLMKKNLTLATVFMASAVSLLPLTTRASSHMDAPLITLDPAANTTDVYAFVSGGENGDTNNYLTVGLGVYPFEEPGIGPNEYNFDPNVLYQIHICTTNKARTLPKAALNDALAGRATVSYQFQFKTTYATTGSILVSYLGVITNIGDSSQNLRQTYTLTKVDHRNGKSTVLGKNLLVPPNNEGIATPYYNVGDDGNNTAKPGVADPSLLDPYTRQAVYTNDGYESFAGQRDDGFYADVLAVFDLLQLRSPGKDSQRGFNIHEMVLRIPISELGSELQTVGVYATTSRRVMSVLRNGANYTAPELANLEKHNTGSIWPFDRSNRHLDSGGWVQVARQGNPLFNEVLVALADKDLYSRTSPTVDSTIFAKYALNPEPCKLYDELYPSVATNKMIESNRTDIAYIYVPDLIKVDLSTGPARLQGGGADDAGYSSLSVFGGDTLNSKLTGGAISGGWPNGRRWGDNVVDIALKALLDSTNILIGALRHLHPSQLRAKMSSQTTRSITKCSHTNRRRKTAAIIRTINNHLTVMAGSAKWVAGPPCFSKMFSRRFTAIVLFLLGAMSSFAHDPGLSSAKLVLQYGTLHATLTFAPADVDSIFNGEKPSPAQLGDVARQSLEIWFDGKQELSTESTARVLENKDVEFALVFPAPNAASLRIRSALLGRLAFGHRQYFSLTSSLRHSFERKTVERHKP